MESSAKVEPKTLKTERDSSKCQNCHSIKFNGSCGGAMLLTEKIINVFLFFPTILNSVNIDNSSNTGASSYSS